jgi:hypothetical protein
MRPLKAPNDEKGIGRKNVKEIPNGIEGEPEVPPHEPNAAPWPLPRQLNTNPEHLLAKVVARLLLHLCPCLVTLDHLAILRPSGQNGRDAPKRICRVPHAIPIVHVIVRVSLPSDVLTRTWKNWTARIGNWNAKLRNWPLATVALRRSNAPSSRNS